MEMLKKISVKTVFGDIDRPAAGDKARPIMDVIGMVQATKVGSSQYGDWTKFIGMFEATNCETGEVFASPVALFPSFMTDTIIGQMGARKEGDPPVHIAVRIFTKYSAKGSTGYEYVVQPIDTGAGQADPLADLRAAVRKALPAPVKAPAAVAGPAKAGKK